MAHVREGLTGPAAPPDDGGPRLCGLDVRQPQQHVEQRQTLQARAQAKDEGEARAVQHGSRNEHPQGPRHEDHALHNANAHGLGLRLRDVADVAEDGHEAGDDAAAQAVEQRPHQQQAQRRRGEEGVEETGCGLGDGAQQRQEDGELAAHLVAERSKEEEDGEAGRQGHGHIAQQDPVRGCGLNVVVVSAVLLLKRHISQALTKGCVESLDAGLVVSESLKGGEDHVGCKHV